MPGLTTEQIQDLRNDLQDTRTPPAFPDDELQRLYSRMGEGYTATVLLALDQLIMGSAKFSDYTQNDTEEKKSQVMANLIKVRAIWQKRRDDESADGVMPPRKTSALVTLRPVWRRKSGPNA